MIPGQSECIRAPWLAGSRSEAQGNSASSRLIWRAGVGFKHQAVKEGGGDRRLALSLILDNVPSLSLFFVFVRAWFADHACSFSSFGFVQFCGRTYEHLAR